MDSLQYKQSDTFDRIMGTLHGRPDVTDTNPSTKQPVLPLIGKVQTFTIRTYREAEVGDWIAVTYGDGEQYTRIVMPPEVSDCIARQRDALTTKLRRKHGRAGGLKSQEARRAAGLPLPFHAKKAKRARRAEGGGR